MAYYLLTGASGLLVSYLLCDCLLAGRRMAVLVRPPETRSAGNLRWIAGHCQAVIHSAASLAFVGNGTRSSALEALLQTAVTPGDA